MYLDITGNYTVLNYHIIGEFPNFSTQRPEFCEGLITPNNYKMMHGVSIYAFYIKGSLGMYTGTDKFTFGKIEFGVATMQFEINLINDISLYSDINLMVASASFGIGASTKFEIIGVSIGTRVSDSLTVGLEGYIGYGIGIDFSNGINVTFAIGVGGELKLEFDWYELFGG